MLAIENARLFQELAARGEEARRAHAAAETHLPIAPRSGPADPGREDGGVGPIDRRIAHEIKNPLNFVNNFAGLSVDLLDRLKKPRRGLGRARR